MSGPGRGAGVDSAAGNSAVRRPWFRVNRAIWMRRLHQWHWISSALCLVCMLMFSVTGVTLNHAGQITAEPQITTQESTLPAELRTSLGDLPQEATAPLPEALRVWLRRSMSLSVGAASAQFSQDEIYMPLPEPGGDAWLAITRDSGEVFYEHTNRGWVAWFNDLHKGRNTGAGWRWFIDAFALATVIFAGTGLVLLYMHSKKRPSTWPITVAGLIIPWLLLMLLVH